MSDSTESAPPTLRQVVLDCEDARSLAEFYRLLLGYRYRPGDEPPPAGTTATRGKDWLVLHDATGSPRLAFQQVPHLPEPTWPEGLDLRCCTSIPPFRPWRTYALSMSALLHSGRVYSLTDPTMRMSPCTSTPTPQDILSASSLGN